MERLTDNQQEELTKAGVKEMLARRQRDGKKCPAILVIDATHGLRSDPDELYLVDDYFVVKRPMLSWCFETFDDFKREALEQGDQQGVEQVRDAMAHRPGRLNVYT